MSELITAENIDMVIKKNSEIKEEVLSQAIKLRSNPEIMQVASPPQLALLILKGFGLIQMPIEDKYWSGAIFVKDGKYIPVLNTALPRANQYFTAWHEIYHLIFDKVSFNHFIEIDNMLEERKAECFAACMLLKGVERYYATRCWCAWPYSCGTQARRWCRSPPIWSMPRSICIWLPPSTI